VTIIDFLNQGTVAQGFFGITVLTGKLASGGGGAPIFFAKLFANV
jgi:hypothetical protein